MKKKGILCLAFLLIVGLTGCGATTSKNQEEKEERIETGFILTGPESYDSEDEALITAIDDDEKKITFLNFSLNKKYTLEYDGTTKFEDKHGAQLSLMQIECGDYVNVRFLKEKKHLTSISLYADQFEISNIENFAIDMIKKELSAGGAIFKITDLTKCYLGGREIDISEISPVDKIRVKGIDTSITSIYIEKGHGYIKLKNDEKFMGGWIDVGEAISKVITENMILTVPEGKYKAVFSCVGGYGTKDVYVNRNEEVTIDIGDLEVEDPKEGMVLFSISPSSAELYVDGEKSDYSLPITLEYGMHQIIVRATDYQSITRYIKVANESQGINIELESNSEKEEEKEEKKPEENKETNVTTNYYKVIIDEPIGAEVYLDGNYIGIAPCSFKKSEGIHEIVLRKTGYESRSYTIQIDKEEKDISYSFTELVKLEQ